LYLLSICVCAKQGHVNAEALSIVLVDQVFSLDVGSYAKASQIA
jgi:hypothetical protein